MEKYELFVAIIGSAAFTQLVNYIFGYKKNKAENKKAEVETEKAEYDLDEQLIKHYKLQISDLLIEVQYLRKEVQQLKNILQSHDDDCIRTDCPNRKTIKS